MGSSQTETPIFLDASGKRWKFLKYFFGFIFLGFSLGAGVMTYRILSLTPSSNEVSAAAQTTNSSSAKPGPPVDELARQLSFVNIPVIGSGPLVKVVSIKGHTAYDIYANDQPRALTSDEILEAGTHQYAFEKYGATTQGKRLVLTYDDGPDPVYTPQLLSALSEEKVPATFFVVGSNALHSPDIMQRIVREGHGVANHSFTHANLEGVPEELGIQEINLTSRVIRATTGYDTQFFRPPYAGSSDQSLRDAVKSILTTQKMGYTVAMYDFDTDDWRHTGDGTNIPMPPFDGADHVLLLHDSGGDRASTVAYTKALIKHAKEQGYTFTTMAGLYPDHPEYFALTPPTTEDSVFYNAGEATLVWPAMIMTALFTMTVVLVFFGTAAYTILAVFQKRRSAKYVELAKRSYRPSVAIIVPAYNEERVLRKCIRSLLTSDYRTFIIYIIDDGSSDNTYGVAKKLARQYKQVRALHKPNGGKASALNFGISHARAKVIIGIDADTQFLPDTIPRMVRHFANPSVGAVAGYVKVGNKVNLIARCQLLEYATSIGLDRTAQAFLGAIMVVPGACGAWKRRAVIDAKKYSSSTLAEDCDLTIAVQVAGYKVLQDNTAIAYTEVPASISSFAKQRFRWTYGNLQVYRKYQNMLFSGYYGWLDSFVLPLAILSALGPLLFLPFLTAILVGNLLNEQYFTILVFASIAFIFQFVRSWIALALSGEKLRYVLLVPVARLIYGPLRIYLIYGTLFRALKGVPVGWGKLARFGMLFQSSPNQAVPVEVAAKDLTLSRASHGHP